MERLLRLILSGQKLEISSFLGQYQIIYFSMQLWTSLCICGIACCCKVNQIKIDTVSSINWTTCRGLRQISFVLIDVDCLVKIPMSFEGRLLGWNQIFEFVVCSEMIEYCHYFMQRRCFFLEKLFLIGICCQLRFR
jgi:hypothetical protein